MRKALFKAAKASASATKNIRTLWALKTAGYYAEEPRLCRTKRQVGILRTYQLYLVQNAFDGVFPDWERCEHSKPTRSLSWTVVNRIAPMTIQKNGCVCKPAGMHGRFQRQTDGQTWLSPRKGGEFPAQTYMLRKKAAPMLKRSCLFVSAPGTALTVDLPSKFRRRRSGILQDERP